MEDKRDVCMLSPCIPNVNFSVVRSGKEVTVQLVINNYNNMMGGLDRSHQIMNVKDSTKKMVQNIWIHFINSYVFSAQVLHKKNSGKLTTLEFRTKLVS